MQEIQFKVKKKYNIQHTDSIKNPDVRQTAGKSPHV